VIHEHCPDLSPFSTTQFYAYKPANGTSVYCIAPVPLLKYYHILFPAIYIKIVRNETKIMEI